MGFSTGGIMRALLKSAVAATIAVIAIQASAQVTFYQREGFAGRSFTADQPILNFEQFGFNDRASSAVVQGGRWQVCQDEGFNGRCVILQPGQYRSLADMGMDNAVSSVRPVERSARYDDNRGYTVSSDYRRRADERLFRADVTDVRAVVGPPEQRCWVERQDVVTSAPSGGANVPGAIAGAVIGGIIGHQIGGGRGRDVATAGGAVGGAALGANIGRGSGDQVVSQDVQKCAYVSDNARPAYWDVTYHFNGYDHHVQMTSPPGPTILVNAQGEPRT
jgi:uncharacterized protein YcfJ